MQYILKGLVDVVFPPRCMACGAVLIEDGASFCPDCFDGIRFIGPPLCYRCGIPFDETGEENHICGECLSSAPAFSVARAAGRYEMVLMDVIHRFKYGGKTSVGERLGKLMAEFIYPAFNIPDYSLIIPVPLHPKRLRQRGFNQAVILAGEIARHFSISLDLLSLKRVVFTESQTSLGKEKRASNVKAAFAVADAGKITGRRIILVDDVITTGCTVNECARALLKSKAEEVAVLTLARAV
jgi:ComF family protein